MKSVNRLLLGSAAGIFVVADAQAADLPAKAQPAEYVRVCSLYGAGFWYIPGTDTCIKIGGNVFLMVMENINGQTNAPIGTPVAGQGDPGGRFDRTDTNYLNTHQRGALSMDVRTQTEYGTARSYISLGADWSTASYNGQPNPIAGTAIGAQFNSPGLFVDRGFVQFAGFTAGRIRSFFDIVSPYGLTNPRTSGDTSISGILGIAYTWQFANGLSASFSLEDSGYAFGARTKSIVNLDLYNNSGVIGATGSPFNGGAFGPMTVGNIFVDNKGQTMLDPVVNIRLDQAWGFAGMSLALHDASGGYYTQPGALCTSSALPPTLGSATGNIAPTLPANSNPAACGSPPPGSYFIPTTNGVSQPPPGVTFNPLGGFGAGIFEGGEANGHPADKYGWAATTGFTLANFLGFQGDTFSVQGVFSVGAASYATKAVGPWEMFGNGQSVGLGWLVDGIFANNTQEELTRVWSVYSGYEHLWTPKWRTAVYGGFVGVEYDAAAHNLICNSAVGVPSISGNPAIAGGPASPRGFSTYGAQGPVFFNGSFQAGTVSNCQPNFSFSQLGARTFWNPVPDINIGLDVVWTHLNTAFRGTADLVGQPSGRVSSSNSPSAGPIGIGANQYSIANQDEVSALFMFSRTFLY